MQGNADIGVIGLAVMGQNLILNMNDKGFSVAVYNRTISKVDEFLQDAAHGRPTIRGAHTVEELAGMLKRPRTVMLMVKAGDAVDEMIGSLLPVLDKGDILIDGGNSYFGDSARRERELAQRGVLFVGTGVSGGEDGARNGPSIMPGGTPDAWPHVKKILQTICARSPSGEPCCNWVGPGGAGHYVKMVHNGIEYGDMQIISEAYNLLKSGPLMNDTEAATVFAEWNNGDLDSYLIEITGKILAHKDVDGTALVGKILDSAGQKGTGKWTSINSLDLGIPVTLIAEAVYARSLSALKDERVEASRLLPGGCSSFLGDRGEFVRNVHDALLASKIVSYAQGFMLLREASTQYCWDLDFGSIALMWREGCIIRSVFLEKIKQAFDSNPALANLLIDRYFRSVIEKCLPGWRAAVVDAVGMGIPVPAFATAISFYDSYRSETLPANLIQAQRDYFGAHTYERIDKPRGQYFHTNWTGSGGDVTSGSYSA